MSVTGQFRLRSSIALLLVSLLVPPALSAQTPRVIKLKPADATLSAEFSSLFAIRELSDRRVLAVDGRDFSFVVGDFATDKATPVSRSGAGPGEYRSISALIALGGDTTLLVDSRNRRWLLLTGSDVVATVAPTTPAIVAARVGERAADRSGHVLSQLNGGELPGDKLGRLDSLYVAIINRETGKSDTVARMRPIDRRILSATPNADGTPHIVVGTTTLSVSEQVTMFSDGWVAIARLDPYRVDWRKPDGQWIRGASIAVPTVKLDDREKRAYLSRMITKGPPPDPSTRDPWPAIVPPFYGYSPILFRAPEGNLLVSRFPSSEHPEPRYDLIDRRGALIGEFSVLKNEQVVGFGAKAIYVTVTDDDGIQRLQRHPWP